MKSQSILRKGFSGNIPKLRQIIKATLIIAGILSRDYWSSGD